MGRNIQHEVARVIKIKQEKRHKCTTGIRNNDENYNLLMVMCPRNFVDCSAIIRTNYIIRKIS